VSDIVTSIYSYNKTIYTSIYDARYFSIALKRVICAAPLAREQ
jgi:hypothetical protein